MAVDQVAIDRLRLDEAFTKKMLHRASDECWTVKCDELLLVVDDDESKVSRFGTDNEDVEKGLLVFNEQRREIVLLSIDNQLLRGVQGGVADCALFDDNRIPLHYHFPEVIITGRGAVMHQWSNKFLGLSMVFNFTNIGNKDNLAVHNTKWHIRTSFGLRL